MKISVAIDGPAGAGKSTIAKLLAKRLNLMYINTGAMYRAVTLKALENNLSPSDIEGLCELIDNLEMHFQGDRLFVNNIDITDSLSCPSISDNVASYASVSEIRERLVKLQQAMSIKYDVVMDGRDIGTVVLKDAAFKFFLTADPSERAKRRYEELTAKGLSLSYKEIYDAMLKRDYDDCNRKINPLTKANDAIEVDTTGLSIEEVVDTLLNFINSSMKIC